MTKVSVVIPTYNRSGTIERAIDSVLNQTFQDFEIVVVDDGSEDKTPEILDNYEDERIRYIRYKPNKGQNHARNVGLKNSKGEYISYLDSDDEFLEEHLEKAVKKIENLPKGYAGIITASEDIRNDKSFKNDVYDGEIKYKDLIRDMYNKIGGLSLLTFRKEILEDIGYHDENVTKCTDLDFYLQILEEYNLFGINEVLCVRYRQENSVSLQAENIVKGEKVIIEKHGDKFNRRNISQRRYDKALAHIELGEISKGRKELFKCVVYNPARKEFWHSFLLSLTSKKIFDKYKVASQEFHS